MRGQRHAIGTVALAGGKTDEAQVHATLAQAYATLLLYLKA